MRGAILPFPQYVFMAWCLVKHRDNFTLPLLYSTKSPHPGIPDCKINNLLAVKEIQDVIT
jgi:hypothetical protein